MPCIVELLLNYPADQNLHPLLQEHRTQLRLLQPQWTTIIQSDIRIKSAVSNAADVASRLLGIETSTTLDWMPTVTAQLPEFAHHDIRTSDIMLTEDIQERIGEDSEGFIVEDVLEDEIEDKIDSDSLIEDADAELIWALPVRGLT